MTQSSQHTSVPLVFRQVLWHTSKGSRNLAAVDAHSQCGLLSAQWCLYSCATLSCSLGKLQHTGEPRSPPAL